MATRLQLEYTCTSVELNEARALYERDPVGRKAKLRSSLVLSVMFVVFLALIYFRIRTEVAPKHQPWFLLIAGGVILLGYHSFQSNSKKPGAPTKLEISEKELVFVCGEARTSCLWSAFSQCLDSPNLFVLMDRSKQLLYTIPKRAFPDQTSQNWFRCLASQSNPTSAPSGEIRHTLPQQSPDAILLSYQLRYRDYLIHNISSWRFKGIALLMLFISIGSCLWQAIHPSPDAVNGPWKVLAIMLPLCLGMLVGVIFLVSSFWWFSESRHRERQQLAISDVGIDFISRDSSGLLPWTTYQNYFENRWSFFVWNSRSSVWFMFPKHAFATELEQEKFRAMLQKHLRPSRWFFL